MKYFTNIHKLTELLSAIIFLPILTSCTDLSFNVYPQMQVASSDAQVLELTTDKPFGNLEIFISETTGANSENVTYSVEETAPSPYVTDHIDGEWFSISGQQWTDKIFVELTENVGTTPRRLVIWIIRAATSDIAIIVQQGRKEEQTNE